MFDRRYIKQQHDGLGKYVRPVLKWAVMISGVIWLWTNAMLLVRTTWNANPICLWTGFTCWSSNSWNDEVGKQWTSGSLVVKTTEQLGVITRLIAAGKDRAENINNLPTRLTVFANQVGDHLHHYTQQSSLGSGTEVRDEEWRKFVAKCDDWKRRLGITAKSAFTLQLRLRAFSQEAIEFVKSLESAWSSHTFPMTSERARIPLDDLRRAILWLKNSIRATDSMITEAEEKGSELIATAIGQVKYTDLEVSRRAETWSWPTTVLVYSVAAIVTASPTGPVIAGIGHYAMNRRDESYKQRWIGERDKYSAAAGVLGNVRDVLTKMTMGLAVFEHDLDMCEESLGVVYSRVGYDAPQRLQWIESDSKARNATEASHVQESIRGILKALENVRVHADNAIQDQTGQKPANLKQQSEKLAIDSPPPPSLPVPP